MFRWYQEAEVCIAWLEDVPPDTTSFKDSGPSFVKSRWWTRGWTLQELIAPTEFEFLASDWESSLGTRKERAELISQVTEISVDILQNGWQQNPSTKIAAATVFAWAANRECTREEDRAYSLLGLLQVNILLLYGEGKAALQRLQIEIIRATRDESIFLRRIDSSDGPLLAPDLTCFQGWSRPLEQRLQHAQTFAYENGGVRMSRRLIIVPKKPDAVEWGGILSDIKADYHMSWALKDYELWVPLNLSPLNAYDSSDRVAVKLVCKDESAKLSFKSRLELALANEKPTTHYKLRTRRGYYYIKKDINFVIVDGYRTTFAQDPSMSQQTMRWFRAQLD